MNLLKTKAEKKAETKSPSNNGWEKPQLAATTSTLKPYSPEWFLVNYLENWSDEDLDVAIRNDVRPDLSTYADLILDQTTDFFLNLLRCQRPDLKHAQSREGREWIRKIVKSATGFR